LFFSFILVVLKFPAAKVRPFLLSHQKKLLRKCWELLLNYYAVGKFCCGDKGLRAKKRTFAAKKS